MTIQEFFRELELRGYVNESAYEKQKYKTRLNNLELDRIRVFKAWYGIQTIHQFNMERPIWQFKLMQAQEDYIQEMIPTTIHFILAEENVGLDFKIGKKRLHN